MITKQATDLLTVKGFITEYFKNLGGLNPKQAYEKTEELYFSHFGRNRYGGHEVFKVMLCRYIKRQKRN